MAGLVLKLKNNEITDATSDNTGQNFPGGKEPRLRC